MTKFELGTRVMGVTKFSAYSNYVDVDDAYLYLLD